MRRASLGFLLLGVSLAACDHVGRRASTIYTTVATRMAPSRVRFTLKRGFIEAYKDRVTIDTRFTVDDAAASVNPAALDGDFHFAGRAPEIGLRLVAEIKNASETDSAVAVITRAAKSRAAVALRGVWRLWPEHALGAREEQDRPMEPLETPYPDHVFEVHPVTALEELSLLGTFHPVAGYRPGAAKRTFDIYQDATCELTVTDTTVTFDTPPMLYNDVHFLMETTGESAATDGGRFVRAKAMDTEGNLLVTDLRMVLVAGTAPEKRIGPLPRGTRLHVWGMPRVSFAEISRRVRGSAANPALLQGPLPYEIVILGVYRDLQSVDE